jgi:hypothetical protein
VGVEVAGSVSGWSGGAIWWIWEWASSRWWMVRCLIGGCGWAR